MGGYLPNNDFIIQVIIQVIIGTYQVHIYKTIIRLCKSSATLNNYHAVSDEFMISSYLIQILQKETFFCRKHLDQ